MDSSSDNPAPGLPIVTHVISTPGDIGGAEVVVAGLATAAPGAGWRAHVLNPWLRIPGDPALRSLVAPIDFEGRRGGRLRQIPGTRRWLARRLTHQRPDVVHVHLIHAAALVSTLRLPWKPVMLLTHHHGSLFKSSKSMPYQWFDRWVSRRYSHIAAVSDFVGDFLIDDYALEPSRISVIRNGWRGTPVPVPVKESRPTVICVAKMRPEKGHETLLLAFQKVLEVVPDARLDLIGDGPLRRTVEQTIARLQLGGSVRLIGDVDDVWPYLARSHVFALASTLEPLGLAIAEAMAAALPVVATRVGGIPELVIPEVTGILVDPGAVEQLAAGISTLLRDARLREAYADAASHRSGLQPASQMIRQYFELYATLLAGRDGRESG